MIKSGMNSNDYESNLHKVLHEIFHGVGRSPLAISQNVALLTREAKVKADGYPPRFATVSRVREWLENQRTSQLYKPIRKKFKRTVFYSPRPNHVWLADCGYLDHLQTNNGQPSKFLLVEDLFSRRLYGRLVRNLKAETIAKAFVEIAKQAKITPKKLGTDKGTEFLSDVFQSQLKSMSIEHYTCNDPIIKCSPVERCMRTIKSMLHRALSTDPERRDYVTLFPIVLWMYNNKKHSALPKSFPTPILAQQSNASELHEHLYGKSARTSAGNMRFKLNLGDIVRISKEMGDYYKGFKPGHWSLENYTISRRIPSIPPRYQLTDYQGNIVEGTFYYEELQKLRKQEVDKKPYKASRVLGVRVQRHTARKQLLIMLDGADSDKKNAYWIDQALVDLPIVINTGPKEMSPPTGPRKRKRRTRLIEEI